jgi:hypothetical protein
VTGDICGLRSKNKLEVVEQRAAQKRIRFDLSVMWSIVVHHGKYGYQ